MKLATRSLRCLGSGVAVFTLIFLAWSVFTIILGAILIVFFLLDAYAFASYLYPLTPYLLIFVGVVSFLSSLYGGLVANSRNKSHLHAYAGVLAAIVIVQLVAIFYTVELRVMIESKIFITSDVAGFAARYPLESSVRAAWDRIQSYYMCCGGASRHDGYYLWRDIPGMNGSAPDSCCIESKPGCGKDVFKIHNIHNIDSVLRSQGCLMIVQDDLVDKVAPIAMVFATIGFLSVICEVAAAFLCLSAASEVDRRMEEEEVDERITCLRSARGRRNEAEAGTPDAETNETSIM